MKEKNTRPPRLAQQMLLRFLRQDLAEEVLGDLDEKFYMMLAETSPLRARLNYWYQVIHYFRPFAIRRSSVSPNHYDMFENYLRIGWRNLSRQKIYSSIKVGGLATGIAACLLIALYIRQELIYDRHYGNRDRIYRVLRLSTFRGEVGVGVHFPAPFANALREDYAALEKVGHYNPVENFGAGSNEVRRVDQPENTHEAGFVFMDQNMLDILELPFIYGSAGHALAEPNTIVITRQKAEKYFGHEDPLGKLLILNNDVERQYKVTGVIDNFPATSHLQYDFLISLAEKEFWKGEQTNWRASNYINYVLVRDGTKITDLENKLSTLSKKYFLPAAIDEGGSTEEIEWLNSFRFKLQPVDDIYLNNTVRDGLKHGDIRYIWLFGAIATFILIIACINFINLSTARSANRAREVGLRKVVGSQRGSLIRQFLTESLLFSFMAFVMGLFLAYLLLPYFNALIAKSLAFPWMEWWWFPVFVVGVLVVGVISGIYPSFYLSSFKPAQVLKGSISRGSKDSTTRSLLVVFQFTVSIILIVCTFIIDRQMNYILTKKTGFDKDQVLILQGTHTLKDRIATFKNELLKLRDVKHATVSSYLPVEGTKRDGGVIWTAGMQEHERVSGQQWLVDHDYAKTLGLKILYGRDFSPGIASDSQATIINESLAKALDLKSPVGQHVFNWMGQWTVIGVMEDFHFESMKQSIQPMGLFFGHSPNTIAVKIHTDDMQATIQSVSAVWKKFSPDQPIRYTFLDQCYAQMYDDDKRMGMIFSSFAVLAIIVACLGLFALSAFVVEQRSKEISIRIVLGASIKSIFRLLTQNFMKLVLISFIIAAPSAWYLMQKWLEDYKYKVDITWDVFLIAGMISLSITLLTISYQAIHAALVNPVKNLRSE